MGEWNGVSGSIVLRHLKDWGPGESLCQWLICIFLPYRRWVAQTVPKVTVHHHTHRQSIHACRAFIPNISSAVWHSAAQQQPLVKKPLISKVLASFLDNIFLCGSLELSVVAVGSNEQVSTDGWLMMQQSSAYYGQIILPAQVLRYQLFICCFSKQVSLCFIDI